MIALVRPCTVNKSDGRAVQVGAGATALWLQKTADSGPDSR